MGRLISRRGFLGTLLGAATVVAVPLKWAYRKISPNEIFCDGTHGDDKNDGLTPATAVRSLQAALDRVPSITRNLTIHMSGTFDGGTVLTLPPSRRDSIVTFDGGNTKAWGKKNG